MFDFGTFDHATFDASPDPVVAPDPTWIGALSEPRRFRTLSRAQPPSFFYSYYIVPAVAPSSSTWFEPLSEPKRFRLRATNLREQIAYVKPIGQTVTPADDIPEEIIQGKASDRTIDGASSERFLTITLGLT